MRNLRLLVQRFANARNLFRSGDGDFHAVKHSTLSSNNGTSQVPLSKKLQIGVRCFSSTEPILHTVVEMPALSPTMSQGNIAKWRKKEGEKINVGDVICEIETDKATLEFECLEEGFLARILTSEGSKDVPVGQPICITVEDSDDIDKIPATTSRSSEQKVSPIHDVKKETIEPKKMSRISPSAKLLISEFGLDTSFLIATGPRGTLLKGDVLAAIKLGTSSPRTSELSKTEPSTSLHEKQSTTDPPTSQPKSSPSLIDMFKDIPNSQIRKVIAKRLLESKRNSPHLYLSKDVMLDQLLAFRNVLKEQHNVKVSINDIIIKAVALALKSVPRANASWNDEKEEAVLCNTVDISIAVATDKGLTTPIVRNADSKSLSTISLEVKELAERARSGKLKPNEFQGGTFSISNLGMYPVDHFCAIINPPQACILAVGRGIKVIEPVLGSDGIEKPAVVTKMNLTLSADHRVFDGDIGGKFLSALSSNLTDVQRLIL